MISVFCHYTTKLLGYLVFVILCKANWESTRIIGLDIKPVAPAVAKDPGSPYLLMMQRIQANSGEMVKNASPVDVISKAILEAVTNKILNLWYLVFKDAETWAASKQTMS